MKRLIRIYRRTDAYRNVAEPLAIFLASRGVVLLGIAYAATSVPVNPISGVWDLRPAWWRFLLRYDSGWYFRIIERGYSYNGNDLEHHPVVFYPLYPLLCKALAALGVDVALSMLLISNLAGFVAASLLFKLVLDRYDRRTAVCAVALASFFPTSVFYSAGYTESLALLLIVAFFIFLERQDFLLAALCAGGATATRSTGVVLLLPLVWEVIRRFRHERHRLLLYTPVYSLLAMAGLIFFAVYLWIAFGSPLAFMSGTRAWQGGRGTFSTLRDVLTLKPFYALNDILEQGFFPNALGPWWFLLFLILLVSFRKRIPASHFIYGLAVLLLPYLTLSGLVGFVSFTRYMLLDFPVFVIMATLVGRSNWLATGVVGVFALMLFVYTAMFAQWYWIG